MSVRFYTQDGRYTVRRFSTLGEMHTAALDFFSENQTRQAKWLEHGTVKGCGVVFQPKHFVTVSIPDWIDSDGATNPPGLLPNPATNGYIRGRMVVWFCCEHDDRVTLLDIEQCIAHSSSSNKLDDLLLMWGRAASGEVWLKDVIDNSPGFVLNTDRIVN
jgi:hypothetical protein